MVIGLMLEKDKVGFYSLFLAPYLKCNKFDETVILDKNAKSENVK